MNAEYIRTLLASMADVMQENRTYLIELDSVVGDGDLGLTMSDGFTAAYHMIQELDELDIGKLLYQAGKAMANAVPSTMGTLMASGWMQAGKVLKGNHELSLQMLANMFQAFEEGVQLRGKARIGEKTFLDGIDPAVKSMVESVTCKDTIQLMAKKAHQAALQGYDHTTTMLAVHGRAATRGEASRKLKDPGAYVAVLMMHAFVKSIK